MARSQPATSPGMTSNGNRAKDPAKDLDAEIAALREDISAITATLGDMVKHRRDEAKSEAKRVGAKAMAKGEDAIEAVSENVHAAEDEIKEMIRDKPIAAVLIAAGTGYLLSKILRI